MGSSYMPLSKRTTWATLEEAMALCAAIKVPCAAAAVPAIPAVPITPAVPIIPAMPVVSIVSAVPAMAAMAAIPAAPAVPDVPAVPTMPAAPPPLRRSERLLNKPRPTTTPLVLAPKKASRKSPCRICKGKQKATPAPVQIRLGVTNMTRFRDSSMVEHLAMGFRFLSEGEEVEGKTTLVLTLGEDIKDEQVAGLDRMEVDIRLGFAAA